MGRHQRDTKRGVAAVCLLSGVLVLYNFATFRCFLARMSIILFFSLISLYIYIYDSSSVRHFNFLEISFIIVDYLFNLLNIGCFYYIGYNPYDSLDISQEVYAPQHTDLAFRAALESIVLLQNRNNILPLEPKGACACRLSHMHAHTHRSSHAHAHSYKSTHMRNNILPLKPKGACAFTLLHICTCAWTCTPLTPSDMLKYKHIIAERNYLNDVIPYFFKAPHRCVCSVQMQTTPAICKAITHPSLISPLHRLRYVFIIYRAKLRCLVHCLIGETSDTLRVFACVCVLVCLWMRN